MTRPRSARLAILRAMLSRRSPLIRTGEQWFVRGWGVTVAARDVEALLAAGFLASPTPRGRIRILTLSERRRALAARIPTHPRTGHEGVAA